MESTMPNNLSGEVLAQNKQNHTIKPLTYFVVLVDESLWNNNRNTCFKVGSSEVLEE